MPRKGWIDHSAGHMLHINMRNNPNCYVEWGWHVAPRLCVRGPGILQVQRMVIDPARVRSAPGAFSAGVSAVVLAGLSIHIALRTSTFVLWASCLARYVGSPAKLVGAPGNVWPSASSELMSPVPFAVSSEMNCAFIVESGRRTSAKEMSTGRPSTLVVSSDRARSQPALLRWSATWPVACAAQLPSSMGPICSRS